MQRTMTIVIALAFIMSVMFWIDAAPSRGAHNDTACATCHSEDVEEAQMRAFVHAPFRDGKCGVCHLPGSSTDDTDARTEKTLSPAAVSDPAMEQEMIAAVDVYWLYEYFEPVQNVLLPLKTTEVEKMLVVELWDQCRGEHQHVVPLPPLQQTRHLPPQSQGKPQIHSLKIARDPHLPDTVVVQCRTNVPVRGKIVLHGEDGDVRSLSTPQGFSSRTQMRIQGLRSNARYELEFAYASVHGADKSSPMHVFVPAQLPYTPDIGSAEDTRGCELAADIEVYQGECDKGTCYFLSVSANQPVTLSVGALKPGVEVPARFRADTDFASIENDNGSVQQHQSSRFHSDIAGRYFTNYEACRPCHADLFGPMTHPVDIVPGVGMTVAPELPLLEDGRISCMTCHVFHGGNDHYRLRFSSKQELCHACHDEY